MELRARKEKNMDIHEMSTQPKPANPIKAEDSSPSSSSYLFVSLYLVILAFFILLNSISKIDEENSLDKINAVKDAIFYPTKNANSLKSQPIENINNDIALQHYLAPIGDRKSVV